MQKQPEKQMEMMMEPDTYYHVEVGNTGIYAVCVDRHWQEVDAAFAGRPPEGCSTLAEYLMTHVVQHLRTGDNIITKDRVTGRNMVKIINAIKRDYQGEE